MKLSELAELCYMSYRNGKETEYQFCKRLTHHPLLIGHYVECLSEDGLEGFIAIKPETKHAVIVFRGTDELEDGWVDITACPISNLRGSGRVHSGIQAALDDAWGTVVGILQDYGVVSAETQGHSLGGMLAELTAQWINTELPCVVVQGVTTFGSGAVGDSVFVEQVQKACKSISHVVSLGDPLPFSATLWALGYKRSGTTEAVSSAGSLRSINSFMFWLHGILNSMRCVLVGGVSPHRIQEYMRRVNIAEY